MPWGEAYEQIAALDITLAQGSSHAVPGEIFPVVAGLGGDVDASEAGGEGLVD